jgi:uncharacterized protein (TIGR00369 family)
VRVRAALVDETVRSPRSAGLTTKYQRLLESIRDGSAAVPPFVARFALPSCTEWSTGRVICEFTPPVEALVEAHVIFGGYIASLIDQYAGLAMYSVLADGTFFRTTELSVRFIHPLRPGPTRIEADVTSQTTREAVCEVRLLQAGLVTSRGVVHQILRSSP